MYLKNVDLHVDMRVHGPHPAIFLLGWKTIAKPDALFIWVGFWAFFNSRDLAIN